MCKCVLGFFAVNMKPFDVFLYFSQKHSIEFYLIASALPGKITDSHALAYIKFSPILQIMSWFQSTRHFPSVPNNPLSLCVSACLLFFKHQPLCNFLTEEVTVSKTRCFPHFSLSCLYFLLISFHNTNCLIYFIDHC